MEAESQKYWERTLKVEEGKMSLWRTVAGITLFGISTLTMVTGMWVMFHKKDNGKNGKVHADTNSTGGGK